MSGTDALLIRLLGGFRAETAGHVIPDARWRLRKAKALVALLALAPGHRLDREQLLDALWPELGPAAGANQLRKALHEARRALDPDPGATYRYVESADEGLRLGPGRVRVDVDAFRTAALTARSGGDPDAYRVALDLYGGELLPEYRYEDWAETRRDAVRGERLALLLGLARLLEAHADLEGAATALSTVLAEEPAHEEAAAALMRVCALAGRRHDAFAAYERLRTALAREVGAEPDVRTQRLYERIRAGRAEEAAGLTGALWEQVGDLRMLSGDASGAAAAFGTAVRLSGDDEGVVSARRHRKAAAAHLAARRTAEAEAHVRAAEVVLAHGDDEAEEGRLAGVRAGLLCETGDLEEAQSDAETSLKTAERVGTPADMAAASETLAIVCHHRGAWREGLRLEIERFGAAADTEARLARIFDIHCCIGEYHLYGDGLSDTVERYARDTLDLAVSRGARRAQAFAWCLLGEALLLQGRWDEAPGCLERSAELHASLDGRSGVLPWQRLGELAAGRGDSTAVAACLRRGMALASVGTLARHAWGRLYATAAFDALERGAPDEALRAVRAEAAASERDGRCPSCAALLNPVAAEAYAELGDRAGAAARARQAAEVAELFASAAWSAMAETARAATEAAGGAVDAARSHHLAAAGLYERARQPYWAARSRVQAVRASPGGAGREEDAALLAAAAVTFDRLGAVRGLEAVRAAGRGPR
ncbi:BTAD domain-containing putative transcriptional regulator [Streptomyces sp. NPDC051921]|uniref:AfsR/SARP family transcriptional regulator n=1 Tax=Streptomyces sp. NPDC051921 TaxID=3155806 RepID=UPI00341AC137